MIVASCPNAHYLHVGSGELEASEQAARRDFDVAERVTFAGQRDDIPELLKASDVYVMPSTHEGMPISCLEAMSCGLPTITTTSQELDFIVDGETGCLVQSEDDLARAMAKLCPQISISDNLGHAARLTTLAEFSVEKSVASYLQLYLAAVHERRVAEGARRTGRESHATVAAEPISRGRGTDEFRVAVAGPRADSATLPSSF